MKNLFNNRFCFFSPPETGSESEGPAETTPQSTEKGGESTDVESPEKAGDKSKEAAAKMIDKATGIKRKPYNNEEFKASLSPKQATQLQSLRNVAAKTRNPDDWTRYQNAVINMAYANNFLIPQRLDPPWKPFSNEEFKASINVEQALELRNLRNDAVENQDSGKWNAYLAKVDEIAAQHNLGKPPVAPMPPKPAPKNAPDEPIA